jgi:hypothetical protein
MNPAKGFFLLILALLTAIPSTQAQQQSEPPVKDELNTKPWMLAPNPLRKDKPEGFYRLDFVIREMDGEKIVDTRNYSMWVQVEMQKTVKAVSEVRVPAGSSVNIKTIGVSISCYVSETDSLPWISMNASITDMMPPEKTGDAPLFRNIGIESMALLSPGKSVTVSKVEDPITKHRFQVDVTGTKLK